MENKKIIFNFKLKGFLIRLPYYFRIWWLMSKNSFLVVLSQKKIFLIFLLAKFLRFFMFFMFLRYLVIGSGGVAEYSAEQIIFFFLTFNFVDIMSQFLFREVYRFRNLVVSGDLDLIMVKPYSTLFRSLMGGADIIDLVTLPPLILGIIYYINQFNPGLTQVIFYITLLLNGLIIATAFHIAVLGMAIITLEIDHTIMIYRDVTALGRLPIDIYREPVGAILTYILPVGIMLSFPVKAFFGILSPWGIIFSLFFGLLSFALSMRFWNFALKKYTSASS